MSTTTATPEDYDIYVMYCKVNGRTLTIEECLLAHSIEAYDYHDATVKTINFLNVNYDSKDWHDSSGVYASESSTSDTTYNCFVAVEKSKNNSREAMTVVSDFFESFRNTSATVYPDNTKSSKSKAKGADLNAQEKDPITVRLMSSSILHKQDSCPLCGNECSTLFRSLYCIRCDKTFGGL